jgi:hypothetical protein
LAYVQSRSLYASSGAFSSNVTAGNILVVAYGGNAQATGCSNTGTCGTQTWNIAVSHNGSGDNYQRIYYAVASGSGTCSVSIAGGGDQGIVLWELSGRDTSSPIDVTAVSTVSGTTTPSTQSATCAAGSDLIGFYQNENESHGGGTAGASYTERADDTSHYHYGEDYCNCSAGSHNASFTSANSVSVWSMTMTAFKAAAGGASPVPLFDYYFNNMRP